MIFKADYDRSTALRKCLKHVVADHTLFGANGMNVDRAGEVKLDSIPGLIILTKHLIASADCQEDLFIFHGCADLCCFSGSQVFQKDFLFKVLTSADEEDIITVCIQRLSDRAAFYIDLDSTILHTAFHCDDIAPVSIQIKDVRVEMTDIQFHNSLSSLFVKCLDIGMLADLATQVKHSGIGRHNKCRCLISSDCL